MREPFQLTSGPGGHHGEQGGLCPPWSASSCRACQAAKRWPACTFAASNAASWRRLRLPPLPRPQGGARRALTPAEDEGVSPYLQAFRDAQQLASQPFAMAAQAPVVQVGWRPLCWRSSLLTTIPSARQSKS